MLAVLLAVILHSQQKWVGGQGLWLVDSELLSAEEKE